MYFVQYGLKFLSWKFVHSNMDKSETEQNLCCRKDLHALNV